MLDGDDILGLRLPCEYHEKGCSQRFSEELALLSAQGATEIGLVLYALDLFLDREPRFFGVLQV